MEIKDLYAFIGILVGWLLNELSGLVKARAEARRALGTAVVDLLRLDAELNRLGMVLHFQKERPILWEQYESIRVATTHRYLTRTDPTEAVSKAADLLASHNPVAALSLLDVSQILKMLRSKTLQPFSPATNEGEYVKALSALEAMIDIAQRVIREMTLKVAWDHSFLSWCRVRLMWRRRRSDIAAKSQEFTESLLSELYAPTDPKPAPPTTTATPSG